MRHGKPKLVCTLRHGKSKLIVILLLLLTAIVLVPLTIVLMNRPNISPSVLPTSNGYDTLSQTGAMVVGTAELFDLDDVEKLKEFVANNSAAADLLDDAIDQESVVPIDYEAGFAATLDSVQVTRQALRLQQAKARIAELEADNSTAANEYAKLFALANKVDREGVMVHFQVASAYRRSALNGLKSVAEDLSIEQKNDAGSIMSGRGYMPLDLDAVLLREDNIAKKEHGTLIVLLTKWHTGKLRQPSIEQAKALDAEIRYLENEVAGLLQP